MIDLHLHSTCSDGTLTPAELVAMAGRKGLKAISITDHDCVAGVGDAFEAGRDAGVAIVSGLELSVVHRHVSLHLLGYGFDWKNQELAEKLTRLQHSRDKRNREILARLEAYDISISYEELATLSGGGQTGRPHIARLLVEKGVVGSMNQAFTDYLKKDGPAYVRRFAYSAEEAISVIHRAGGVAVLAHPVQLDRSLETLPQLVAELTSAGLDGIETYYPTQKGKIRKKLRQIAREFELLETGGSDYHGDIKPGTAMAGGIRFSVPVELYERLQERLTVK
ncbi:MAG: phosphoesterase [Desulfobacterales bacterium]|nr:MAG: phosphoesterase [Desulfobacterales bacterium]